MEPSTLWTIHRQLSWMEVFGDGVGYQQYQQLSWMEVYLHISTELRKGDNWEMSYISHMRNTLWGYVTGDPTSSIQVICHWWVVITDRETPRLWKCQCLCIDTDNHGKSPINLHFHNRGYSKAWRKRKTAMEIVADTNVLQSCNGHVQCQIATTTSRIVGLLPLPFYWLLGRDLHNWWT